MNPIMVAGRVHPGKSRPALPDGRLMRLAATLVLGLLLGACGQTVTVPARFPEPVVDTLPLRVGVVYPEAFRNHEHREALGNGSPWNIRTGEANVALFDAVFRRLFTEVRHLDARPEGDGAQTAGLDAVLEPEVTGFEFASPAQSGTDQYSVWIRYTLNVYGPDGQAITAWRINAYGQGSAKALQPARSMEVAARQALRDAGATISLEFAREPAIRSALLGNGAGDPALVREGPAREPAEESTDPTPGQAASQPAGNSPTDAGTPTD
jgi:hypothetical protein